LLGTGRQGPVGVLRALKKRAATSRRGIPAALLINGHRPRTEAHRAEPKAMMDFLRKATYELSPKPLKSFDYGYEYEAKYRA
jgi:hypothetical protein